MPNTAAQKISAMSPRSNARPPDPVCSSWSRVNTLRHFGVSRVQTPGRMMLGALRNSGLDNGVELMILHAAGELEEEVFQTQILRGGLLLHLCHGTMRYDFAAMDDGQT